jgi:hypothetical protein
MTISATTIAEQAPVGDEQPILLSLDALVRSIGVRRGMPLALFLGAGASTSSGLPSAQMCVWEFARLSAQKPEVTGIGSEVRGLVINSNKVFGTHNRKYTPTSVMDASKEAMQLALTLYHCTNP